MHWLSTLGATAVLTLSGCGDDGAGGGGTTSDPSATEGTGPMGSSGPGGTGPGPDSTGDPDTGGPTTSPPSECGNAILEGIEECDDGNAVDGDGCDSDCTLNLDTSQWQDTHGGDAMVRDSAQGIAVDSQGNVVVGGYEVDAVGDPDMWLAKYDPEGTQLWALELDPSMGLDDRIYAVAVDPSDRILVAGDVDVAPGSSDLWVAAFDPDGAEQWSTSFDGPEGGNDGGRGIATDDAGNVLVTGFVRVGNNDNDVFVAKLGPGGATTWTDTVAGPDLLDDRGQGVVTDPAGNAYVAGYVTAGGFDRNVWLRKYDADGADLWTELWDSPGSADDAGFGLARAPDGTVAVAGMTPVIADNQDVWLGRWDEDGNLLWIKQFGGQAFVNDQGLAIAADSASNFVVAGYRGMSATDSDIWLRKYDAGGNVLWAQVVAGLGMDRDQATAIATDANDDILVAGEIRNAMSNDGDVWLGKFGPG
ncbi:MAG: hypothetical protein AB1Z98_31485 [Nannocystaceae bacterium]